MQNCRVDEKNHDIASAIDRRTFHRTAGQGVAAIVSLYLGLASPTAAASGENGGKLTIFPVPRAVPAFSFQNEQGQSLSLQTFHGKLIVLNLWATWCAPCVTEMPSLDRLHKKLAPRGGMVLALSQDRGGLAKVAPFLAQNRLDLAPYLDMSNAAHKALAIAGLPTTAIVAPNGLEVARLIGGAVWDGPDMIRQLEVWLTPTAL